MDVHIWRFTQKVLNRPVVKVFAKAVNRRAAEDDVSNAFLANEVGCGMRNAFPFDGEDLRFEIACKLQVGCERAFFFIRQVLIGVDMQNE